MRELDVIDVCRQVKADYFLFLSLFFLVTNSIARIYTHVLIHVLVISYDKNVDLDPVNALNNHC